jgi:hypothetical protein
VSTPSSGERESSSAGLTALLWTIVALLAVFELAWLWAKLIFAA